MTMRLEFAADMCVCQAAGVLQLWIAVLTSVLPGKGPRASAVPGGQLLKGAFKKSEQQACRAHSIGLQLLQGTPPPLKRCGSHLEIRSIW